MYKQAMRNMLLSMSDKYLNLNGGDKAKLWF